MSTLGTGNDLAYNYDGSNTTITYNGTGNFSLIDNGTTSSIIAKLGTSTSATSFKVRDSGSIDMLSVDGNGVATINGRISINPALRIGNSSTLGALTTGIGNIAIGDNSAVAVTTGNWNIAIGDNSAAAVTTASWNTVIGSWAMYSGSYVNCTVLGDSAEVTDGHQVQLGDSNTTTYVYGTVQNRSDERDKADIVDTDLGLDFINLLRPVCWKWDFRSDYLNIDKRTGIVPLVGTRKRTRPHYGLVGQEVKSVLDSIGKDFGGYQDHSIDGGKDVLSLGYDEFICPLIKAVQELSARVVVLEATIAGM